MILFKETYIIKHIDYSTEKIYRITAHTKNEKSTIIVDVASEYFVIGNREGVVKNNDSFILEISGNLDDLDINYGTYGKIFKTEKNKYFFSFGGLLMELTNEEKIDLKFGDMLYCNFSEITKSN